MMSARGWLLGEIGVLPSGGTKMANAMNAKSMVFCKVSTVGIFFQHPVMAERENNS